MRRLFHTCAAAILVSASIAAAQDVTGFWKTIDDETGKARSVVAIYMYDGRLYGRVILSYQPDGVTVRDDIYRQQRRSPFLVGEPAFCGLDIMWDLTERGGRWRDGSIMDPGDQQRKPRVYGAEVWREGSDLTVRGKIAIFGRNQTWKPFAPTDFPASVSPPDTSTFRPVIPRIK